MISPQEITYFLECAKSGNISRAAERLGVTQPTLTVALRRLEHSAGAELFHRSKKGVRLTKAGEVFQHEAKSMLDHWKKVQLSLQRSNEDVSGSFTLGAHPSVALYSFPQTIPGLLQEFPRLKLELRHDLSRKITEQVIRGDIDLAIVVNPVRHPDLVIKHLCKDRVSFWTSKEATPCNRLHEENCVLLCNPDMLQIQNLLRKLKQEIPRTITSPHLEMIAALANSGGGIAILPTRIAQQWKNLKIMPECPSVEDEIALLYRTENRAVTGIRELAKRLERGLSNHS